MRENFWLKQGTPEDLESPPHGKLLRVKYSNGDYLKVEFFELESALAASSRYSEQQVDGLLAGDVTFPLTAVGLSRTLGEEDGSAIQSLQALPGGNSCSARTLTMPTSPSQSNCASTLSLSTGTC
jgi:hypothetical protein